MPDEAFTLYHAGSAKRVLGAGRPSDAGTVRGRFEFTDDWSVFDFGHFHKPPVPIKYKGEALCRQTTWGFANLLPRLGIPSHFKGAVDATTIEVELVQIERDYSRLPRPNYLLPFEVIFRYRVLGSLYDRLKEGKRDYREFGFTAMPAKGDRLPNPFAEFTTKLEPIDRNLGDEEAREMARLTKEELNHVKETTMRYANGFGAEVERRGLQLGDGKLEFVQIGDSILVGDVVCTLDEHRLSYGGRDLSKEINRDHYRITGYKAHIDAELAAGRPFPKPPPLEPGWAELDSDAYRAMTVAVTGEEWAGAPSLDVVSRRYDELLEELKGRFAAPQPAKVA
jgi:phosphoribosylaminoimidazole-succinocarboxamide synthase